MINIKALNGTTLVMDIDHIRLVGKANAVLSMIKALSTTEHFKVSYSGLSLRLN